MNLTYTPEQQMLHESVRRYFETDYSFAKRREALAGVAGFSRARWTEFAELGWLGAAFPEEAGGYGGSVVEAAIILEGAGSGLVVEPLLSCAVLAAQTLQGLGDPGAERLAALLAGEQLFALAHQEVEAGGEGAYVATRAEASGNGYVLSGRKAVVLGAPSADELLVSARTAGAVQDPCGVSLFTVAPAELNGRLRACRTIDDLAAADIDLDGLQLPASAKLGEEGGAFTAIDHALDHALVATCAEAVGAMDKALAVTVEHLKTRKQFGVTLSTFQALQHRVADMSIALEQARSAVLMGLAGLSGEDAVGRARSVSAAKVRVGESARFIAAQAVQLHGGIGVTDEHVISHYFKKLTAFHLRFGSQDYHLTRYAALG